VDVCVIRLRIDPKEKSSFLCVVIAWIDVVIYAGKWTQCFVVFMIILLHNFMIMNLIVNVILQRESERMRE